MLASYRYSVKHTVYLRKYLQENIVSKKQGKNILKNIYLKYNLDNDLKSGLINCKLKDQTIYFLTLHKVLLDYFEKNTKESDIVDINLEIDQTASGMVLLSLVLGIKPMAESCNLLSKTPTDIYSFVMKQIPQYFEGKTFKEHFVDEKGGKKTIEKPFEKKKVLPFLSNNRKVQKGALMRWCYSEGWKSRRDTWLLEFKDNYKRRCTNDEFKTIDAFSRKYDDFLEEVFPKLQSQKECILNVLRIRARALKENAVNIKTLDGCNLSWDFDPVDLFNKTYYNPVIGKAISYKIYKENPRSALAVEGRLKSLERSLFPNLIHSIDAAIMRIIITRVYDSSKYRINHLHDCVLIHPNYVDVFYDVVSDIYTEDTLTRLASKLFFEPMTEGLASDLCDEIKKIQKGFEDNMDTIDVTKDKFEPRNMYVLEGGVTNTEVYEEELKKI